MKKFLKVRACILKPYQGRVDLKVICTEYFGGEGEAERHSLLKRILK